MSGSPEEIPVDMKSTRPAITSVSASGPPLNGMCSALMPALSNNRSAPQCVALPIPAEAKLNVPARPAAISSGSVLMTLERGDDRHIGHDAKHGNGGEIL